MSELPELPELRMFDPAATRGAVFRGLLRTTMLVGAIFVAFAVTGAVLGRVVFQLHDRHGAFERVGVMGFAVGHPAIVEVNGVSAQGPSSSWLHTTKTMGFDQADGSTATVKVKEDLLGRISVSGDTHSKLDTALASGRASRAQCQAFLRGLPGAAVLDVVLEFRTPLSETAEEGFASREAMSDSTLFYDDPFSVGIDTDDGFHVTQPVAWPNLSLDGYRGRFSDWTAELTSHDDGTLARLGLPSSHTLMQLGDASLVHALYVRDVTPADLADLLAQPEVQAFTPVDVRFDIMGKARS